eukprot:scaffold2009_cov64-Isochrysis_galbana.AAC.1
MYRAAKSQNRTDHHGASTAWRRPASDGPSGPAECAASPRAMRGRHPPPPTPPFRLPPPPVPHLPSPPPILPLQPPSNPMLPPPPHPLPLPPHPAGPHTCRRWAARSTRTALPPPPPPPPQPPPPQSPPPPRARPPTPPVLASCSPGREHFPRARRREG